MRRALDRWPACPIGFCRTQKRRRARTHFSHALGRALLASRKQALESKRSGGPEMFRVFQVNHAHRRLFANSNLQVSVFTASTARLRATERAAGLARRAVPPLLTRAGLVRYKGDGGGGGVLKMGGRRREQTCDYQLASWIYGKVLARLIMRCS